MQCQHPQAAAVGKQHPLQVRDGRGAVKFEVGDKMASALVAPAGGAAGKENPLRRSAAQLHIFERRSADRRNCGDGIDRGRGCPEALAKPAIGLDHFELAGKDGQRQLLKPGRVGTVDKIQDLRVDRHVNQIGCSSSDDGIGG